MDNNNSLADIIKTNYFTLSVPSDLWLKKEDKYFPNAIVEIQNNPDFSSDETLFLVYDAPSAAINTEDEIINLLRKTVESDEAGLPIFITETKPVNFTDKQALRVAYYTDDVSDVSTAVIINTVSRPDINLVIYSYWERDATQFRFENTPEILANQQEANNVLLQRMESNWSWL